jgi:hypothetical protein
MLEPEQLLGVQAGTARLLLWKELRVSCYCFGFVLGWGPRWEDYFFCWVIWEKFKVGIREAEAAGSIHLPAVWPWGFQSLRKAEKSSEKIIRI